MRQKKTLLILAALLLAATFVLSACGGNAEATGATDADMEQLREENQELEDKVAELEEQIAELSASEAPAEEAPAETPAEAPTETLMTERQTHAIGINCLLYITDEGADAATEEIFFTDSVSISAAQNIPNNQAFDYWLVNGQRVDTAELIVDANNTTVIEAVVRDELTVTSVNANIQLLNNGSPSGEKMQEYNFEKEQKISIYVSAVIPTGYEIDHWLIDGYPYHFSRDVTYFKVLDLDRASTYEAVLEKTSVSSQPAETSAPAATPAPVMVNVSCSNATFSGGGYSGATSGQVEKGTTITVTGTNDIGSPQYWLINGSADWTKGKSFSYTVNSSTSFEYTGVN